MRIAPGHEYFLYITDASNPYYSRLGGLPNVHLRVVPSPSPFVRMPLLGLQTFRDAIDLLHATYYGPPIYRGKLILTVHDLSYLHVPDSFSAFDRVKDRLLVPFFARRARAVLTVSEYSRREIADAYHLPPGRIYVSYNGVDPVFRPVEDRAAARRTIERYAISGGERYILFVGRINRRKNLTGLVKSFDALKAKGYGHSLVITGPRDFLPAEDEAAITGSPYAKEIKFTGLVPHAHLPALYGLADVFAYPSLYEGFGLPCLEAMACGCPVVSSDCTSLPEVVGDAGLLVRPGSVDALTGAMERILSDDVFRRKCINKGLDRAGRFTWESAAHDVARVFEAVARGAR